MPGSTEGEPPRQGHFSDPEVTDGSPPASRLLWRAVEDVAGSVDRMTPNVIPRPVEVSALEPHRIWLRYDDGVEGEVDLSHLAGHGVFAAWEEREFFAGVYIGPLGGISWSERIDLCPDAVYMRLTDTLDKSGDT